jgi:molybdopterin converting factor small subunit
MSKAKDNTGKVDMSLLPATTMFAIEDSFLDSKTDKATCYEVLWVGTGMETDTPGPFKIRRWHGCTLSPRHGGHTGVEYRSDTRCASGQLGEDFFRTQEEAIEEVRSRCISERDRLIRKSTIHQRLAEEALAAATKYNDTAYDTALNAADRVAIEDISDPQPATAKE